MVSVSEKTAERIVEFLCSEKAIQSKDKDIYRYGFDVFIYSCIQILFLTVIGIIAGKPWQTLLYLAVVISLRKYTGGFHARTRVGCTITACAFLCCMLFAAAYHVTIMNNLLTYLICTVFYFICVAYYVPVEHKNKPLTDGQKITYRKRSLNLSIMWLIIAVIARICRTEAGSYIIYALLVVAVSLIMAQGRRKEA